MSKVRLADFLEAFDLNTMIELLDVQDGKIYHGEVGNVRQHILNCRKVALGI